MVGRAEKGGSWSGWPTLNDLSGSDGLFRLARVRPLPFWPQRSWLGLAPSHHLPYTTLGAFGVLSSYYSLPIWYSPSHNRLHYRNVLLTVIAEIQQHMICPVARLPLQIVVHFWLVITRYDSAKRFVRRSGIARRGKTYAHKYVVSARGWL